MTEQILELLTSFGLPALFGVLVLTAMGMPFPSSLVLIAMGSLVAQGQMEFWPVVLTGAAGARLPRALYSQRVNEMAKLRSA